MLGISHGSNTASMGVARNGIGVTPARVSEGATVNNDSSCSSCLRFFPWHSDFGENGTFGGSQQPALGPLISFGEMSGLVGRVKNVAKVRPVFSLPARVNGASAGPERSLTRPGGVKKPQQVPI